MDNQTKETLFSAVKGYAAGFVVEKGLEFIIPGLDIADGVIEIAGAVWCAYRSKKRQKTIAAESVPGTSGGKRSPFSGSIEVIPAPNNSGIPAMQKD